MLIDLRERGKRRTLIKVFQVRYLFLNYLQAVWQFYVLWIHICFSFLRGVYTSICLCYESVIQYIFLGACELVLMHEVTYLAEKSENFLEDNFFIFLWQILLQLNTDNTNASPSKWNLQMKITRKRLSKSKRMLGVGLHGCYKSSNFFIFCADQGGKCDEKVWIFYLCFFVV